MHANHISSPVFRHPVHLGNLNVWIQDHILRNLDQLFGMGRQVRRVQVVPRHRYLGKVWGIWFRRANDSAVVSQPFRNRKQGTGRSPRHVPKLFRITEHVEAVSCLRCSKSVNHRACRSQCTPTSVQGFSTRTSAITHRPSCCSPRNVKPNALRTAPINPLIRVGKTQREVYPWLHRFQPTTERDTSRWQSGRQR
jgi:uncharacterized membrane protein